MSADLRAGLERLATEWETYYDDYGSELHRAHAREVRALLDTQEPSGCRYEERSDPDGTWQVCVVHDSNYPCDEDLTRGAT